MKRIRSEAHTQCVSIQMSRRKALFTYLQLLQVIFTVLQFNIFYWTDGVHSGIFDSPQDNTRVIMTKKLNTVKAYQTFDLKRSVVYFIEGAGYKSCAQHIS